MAELAKAKRIVAHAEQHKHPTFKLLERASYWALLGVTLIAVFCASIAIWPATLLANSAGVALIVFALGASLGALYAHVAGDLELDRRHHALSIVFIAVAAFASAYLVTNGLRGVQRAFGVHHDPLLLGFVYAFALILPMFIKLSVEAARA